MTPTRALIEALEWYIENDDVNEGDPENAFYIEGKRRAEAAISSAKAAEEGVEQQVAALKVENDRMQTSNAAMRRRLEDIANQYAVDCL